MPATAAAARTLEIFLDLVCAEATDLSAVLVSGEFDHLLDDDERAVATVLCHLQVPASSGPIAGKAADLLVAFGARGQAERHNTANAKP